ncbi:MAG TPA: AI-2E family transporter [Terriglobales bacterium]|nr:AI-2E family transporter [Terriglobales bacterium]
MSAIERVTDIDAPTSAAQAEEEELLHASIRAGSLAQIVVAVVAVLGLAYLLKVVMVTTLSAVLLAFIIDPLVSGLEGIRIPRCAGALMGVVLLIVVVLGLSYFFYNRAVDFATELPKYSSKIRQTVSKIRYQTNKIAQSTRSVVAAPDKTKAIPVEVKPQPDLLSVISGDGASLLDDVVAVSFVPFLIYFMLTWKDHAHRATVQLFAEEHRQVAHRTVARISNMIRAFIVGNAVIGVMNSAVGIAVFWALGIPYFYFIGVISGFASLIPYLGVFLALLPPLAAGLGVLDRTAVLIVFVTVIGLHIITMNVFYPKVVGKRLRLNPLAVTLALLFWAFIWGTMGLLLAVPLVGAAKITCDHIDSLRGFGAWLGE